MDSCQESIAKAIKEELGFTGVGSRIHGHLFLASMCGHTSLPLLSKPPHISSKYHQSVVMTGGSNYNRFATCTECIGFESLTEKDIHCWITDPVQLAAVPSPVRRPREETKQCRVFPPFLTSLCENGRPRFSLVKMRDNGRLGIAAVLNHGPEVLVVRSIGEEGGHVRIRSLDNFGASEF